MLLSWKTMSRITQGNTYKYHERNWYVSIMATINGKRRFFNVDLSWDYTILQEIRDKYDSSVHYLR